MNCDTIPTAYNELIILGNDRVNHPNILFLTVSLSIIMVQLTPNSLITLYAGNTLVFLVIL